jgi:hypothetical protein
MVMMITIISGHVCVLSRAIDVDDTGDFFGSFLSLFLEECLHLPVGQHERMCDLTSIWQNY